VLFLTALIFDLVLAVTLIVSVARLVHRHSSRALLSYMFYLISWYALVLYILVFLFAPQFLPEDAQRGYMMFNSIFVVPLNGLVALFYADFIWKWLNKSMPRLLRFILPIPFLVILVVYAKEMLDRLSTESHSETFVIAAPASLGLMFAFLLLVSLYAAIAPRRLKDRERARHIRLSAAVTGSGLIIGLLFIFGSFSFLGRDWQNVAASMVLASVNIGGWVFARGFFRREARTQAAELAKADLGSLEAHYGISPREREIISLVIAGKSNREISEALYISLETVKKHIYNAYRKIGIKNRVQLVNVVLKSSAGPTAESE
jgi:DNA-binding CsgD family transcriptional regulator